MKLTEAQIGWLAGILDGEGNLQLCLNGQHLRPVVVVLTNTNPLLIQAVVDLLTKAGLHHRVQNLSKSPRWRKEWKPAWSVAVGRIDDMKAFLTMVEPHLVGKKEQAQILLKFLKPRRSRKPYPGSGVPTNEYEKLLGLRVKELNSRGASESQTTNTPNAEKLAKIESELHGDMQSQAEMTWPETIN
jgi:hypothetical protein